MQEQGDFELVTENEVFCTGAGKRSLSAAAMEMAHEAKRSGLGLVRVGVLR